MNEAGFSPDSGPTSERKRYWRLAGVLVCLLLAVMIGLAYPLRSVVLFVTGNSYSLGDIPPGAISQTTVKCTGDSHLEIEFVGDAGDAKRLDAGGFFQPGYRGTIRVSVKDGVIEGNEQDIQWWPN